MVPEIFDYDVIVHPRVFRVHGIDEQDVISAWNNALPLKRRDVPRNSLGKDEYVTIGFDTRGRPIELVATPDMAGRFWLVYHGVRLATKGFVREYKRMGA